MNIVILGASSDLGRPISEALAKQGHDLVLHFARNSEKIAHLTSAKATPLQADLTNPQSFQNFSEKAITTLSKVDTLINMIGPYSESPLLELTPTQWKQTLDFNLNVIFESCFLFKNQILKNKGHIINFCYDGVENIRSWENATAYAAAKAGLAILTKSLARAMAPHGARVNAICPGYIDSEHFSLETREMLNQSIPSGRMGQANEIVSLLSWLVNESPSYMTGALLPIGGAWEHGA